MGDSGEIGDFSIEALYEALDARRVELGLTWAEVTRQINDGFGAMPATRAIAGSTITGMRSRGSVEGDGVIQMLIWLGRAPERFVVGGHDSVGEELARVGPNLILRWDAAALHAAIDAERTDRGLTWKQIADEIGCTPGSLTGLASSPRVAFPGVMRIVGWLGRPAAAFTRASDW